MPIVDGANLGVTSSSGSAVDYLNNFWKDTPYNMDFSSQGTSTVGAANVLPYAEAYDIAAGNYQGAEDSDHYDPTGYEQAQWEYERQMELLAEQRAFNSAEAQKNRDWQERMSNTAYQRAVQDLEAAGLNKWLAVTGGNGASASTPSGSSATSSAGDASAPNPTLLKAILQMFSSMYNSSMKIIDLL